MHPPGSFSLPPPGADPAATAAALTRSLAARGVTGVYIANADRVAVVSVSAGVTAWTDGRRIWCTCAGQHYTWSAADIEAAAAALADLACPPSGS